MRTVRACVLAALAVCALAAGVARAEATAAPAPASDVVVYVEAQKAEAHALLGMVASMPAMKLFMPQVQSRFYVVEQLLHLPPGSFDEAAPHMTRAAFVLIGGESAAVLTFDSADWPQKLAPGEGEITAIAHGADLAMGSATACRAVADGELDTFLKSPDLLAARASAGDSPTWGYIGIPALQAALAADDPADAAEMAGIMAMAGLDATPYGVLTMQGDGPEGSLTLTLKGNRDLTGVLGMLPQGVPEMPALVPEGESASVTLDWGDAAELLGLAQHTLGFGPPPGPDGGGAQIMGIGLDKLSAQLGSGAAAFLPVPGPDGMLSRGDITIVVHLKDPAGFRKTLDTILMTQGLALTPDTFDGTEMLQLMAPPCYMKFLDDRLVIGASPGAVNGYLKAALPKEPQGPAGALAVRADVGLLTHSYPKPAPGGKLYITLVRKGRDVVLTAGYAGMKASSIGTVYSAYMATILAWMLPMRAVSQAEMAEPALVGGNLRQIGIAITMYRAEHDGQYPPSLEELVEDAYVPGPSVLVDAADANPQTPAGGQGHASSYEYAGPLPANAPPSFIVAYSRKGIHPGAREVLYVDGAVSLVSEQDLHTDGGARGYSMPQQYDWLMALHGGEYTDEQKAAFRKFYEAGEAAHVPAAHAPGAPAPAPVAPMPAVAPPDRSRQQAQVTKAKVDISTLGMALDMFDLDNGRYPSTVTGLKALVTQPPGMDQWSGPYIKGAVPLDPWGHAYVYVCPGAHNADGYDLSSFGPDGKEGGGDDVDNWSRGE